MIQEQTLKSYAITRVEVQRPEKVFPAEYFIQQYNPITYNR